ncbi:MAG: rhomboid family intramembrane serine protease [Balneola sp.]|nr:MAG: rhomboid family intramembrane serine protease [Balneola sp.]
MDQFQPNTRFSVFPPAVKYLLIWNGIFFFATTSIYGGWTPIGAMFSNLLVLQPVGDGFMPWQLVTYMFLHADMSHIFFNLFALWIFGQSLENLWGTRRFLMYYFLTGIGAGIIHLIFSGAATIGASGAVFGILLGFGMMFPDRYIILLFPPIPIKAKYFVGIYGVIELFSGLSRVESGVAHFAHLGGLVIGFILIKIWKIKKPMHY